MNNNNNRKRLVLLYLCPIVCTSWACGGGGGVEISLLKTLDTIGNCQRLVFSLAVSHHKHKITNIWKFELNRSSKLRDNDERKTTLVTRSCVLSDAWFRDIRFSFWGLETKIVENYFFFKNYVSSEGAYSDNVLYFQPLPITRYQVSFLCYQVSFFYANNYCELSPIVSTAFKVKEWKNTRFVRHINLAIKTIVLTLCEIGRMTSDWQPEHRA